MHRSRNPLALLAVATAALLTPVGAVAQVLADGDPPLTQEIVAEFVKATEFTTLGKFTPQQTERMRTILIKYWSDGTTPRAVVGTVDGMRQLRALPARTQRLALTSNIMGFLIRADEAVKQGDESSILMLEVYRQSNPALVPEAPLFSKALADAYIDAFLFLGSVQSGKPEPKLSEASRQKLRVQLARDFAKAEKEQREQFQENVAKVMGHMIQWPNMDELDRLLVRADLGAKLTPQEQQTVMQARQMMSQHNHQMMSNQLNFMKQNTDTIMGSAPYWNPSENRWEQKGGIVTEFGVTSVKGG